MSEETLSVRYVRVLLDALEPRGVSRPKFLASAGWDAAQLDHADGRIPASEYYRLCELAMDLTGDARMGLLTLEAVRPPSVDLVGQLVAHAPNARQAIDTLLRMHKLTGDRRRYTVSEAEGSVTLRYACPEEASARARRFMAELHMFGGYVMFRYFVRGARPVRVSFEYPPPPYAAEYRRLFEGTECFDQAHTEILFETDVMDTKRRYRDDEIHQTLQDLARHRISRMEREASHAERVRSLLLEQAEPGRMTMDAIARSLGMSQRSLRRRLTAEGTSVAALLSEALAERARRLLTIEGRTIQETAFALGYSDPTAFHRAFKRWTGKTPKAWREATSTNAE